MMSDSVHLILLRPVLGIVLARDSVLLRMERLRSRLQPGHHAVPSAGSYSICKTAQECTSDTKSVTEGS